MGHECIGVVEDTGSAVTTVKKGELVIAPSRGPTAPVTSAVKACRPPAVTVASGTPVTSAACRPRPCGSRSRTAPSCPSQPARTRR